MHPVLFHIGAIVVPSYGALAAIGVLLALMLALYTARKIQIDPNRIWTLCIIALFTALIGSRLLLIVANWTVLRSHPLWMLSLAMIHHPLIAAIGAAIAFVIAAVYATAVHLPYRATADVLAAPVALGLAFEQIGALLAGSSYGTGAEVRWAVTYTDPLAARWSDAPLGIPVHPVQAYAAFSFFLIALALVLWLPHHRQNGDLAGLFLIATGIATYITEFWRDPIGRGALFHGFLKAPQAAAIVLVIVAALLLLDSPTKHISAALNPSRGTSSEQAHV